MVKVKMFDSVSREAMPAMEMPPLDAQAFHEVVDSRRSVRIYAADGVPDDVVDRCVDAAHKAPNSSNLQCWELHRVSSADKKKALVEACLGQPAASTAPELFVFVARPDLWKRNNRWMIEEFDRSGDTPDRAYQYFRKITKIAYTQGVFAWVKRVWFPMRALSKPTPREPIGWADMRVWAHKSTALSSAHFMLGDAGGRVRHVSHGGHGQRSGQEDFGTASRSEVCMVVSAGKRTEKGVYGPRFRFERGTFYHTH